MQTQGASEWDALFVVIITTEPVLKTRCFLPLTHVTSEYQIHSVAPPPPESFLLPPHRLRQVRNSDGFFLVSTEGHLETPVMI